MAISSAHQYAELLMDPAWDKLSGVPGSSELDPESVINFEGIISRYRNDFVKSYNEQFFPDSLIESIATYMLFCRAHLIPYLFQLKALCTEEQPENDIYGEMESQFALNAYLSLSDSILDEYASSNFRQRLSAGLVREGQIQLIKTAMSSLMDEIRILKANRQHEKSLWEICVACYNAGKLLDFFKGERFRSERLEVLLLKYLDEKQVDAEFVRAFREVNSFIREPNYLDVEKYRRMAGFGESDANSPKSY